MVTTDDLRLIVPPGLAPRLRVHPLLEAPPGGTGVFADFAGDELRLSSRGCGQAAMFGVASQLADIAPLRLKLADGSSRHASEVVLHARMPLGAAMREVLREGLAHLLDNVTAATAGDMEGVHQARVAIRRLRAAMRLFRPVLERAHIDAFDGWLRGLGHVLGEARDWDVFLHETFPELTGLLGDDAMPMKRLRDAAIHVRAAARAAVAARLASPSFSADTLRFAAWLVDLPEDPDTTLGAAAPKLLDRMARQVIRRGRRIEQASWDDLHSLRKSLKRLRYGVEFVEHLYHNRPVKAYLRAIKDLQSVMGRVNDARVTLDLVRHLKIQDEGRIAAWADHRAGIARQQVHFLVYVFRGFEVPWRPA